MRITKYGLQLNEDKRVVLVKEMATNYQVNELTNKDKIAAMLNDLFGLANLTEEHLYVVAMTKKCRPIGVFEVSHGTASASILPIREIFVRLFLCGAVAFAVVHNHPSGNALPSQTDISATKKLAHAAKLMDIDFLDHIVLGNEAVSIRELEPGIFS